MFLGKRYYNEDNISTIDYSVTTKLEAYDVYSKRNSKLAVDELWIHNKTKNTIKLYKEEDSWSNSLHSVLTEREITNIETQAKENRQRHNEADEHQRQLMERHHNLSERDIKLKEEQAIQSRARFNLHKDILSRKIQFSYVYEEGFITAKIVMNNSTGFDEDIQHWCHKQGIEKGKLVTLKKIDRVYKDEDVTIEYVYSVLDATNKKTKKDFI